MKSKVTKLFREELLRRQHAQQIEGLQRIIQSQLVRLDEKDQTIEESIAAGQREVQQLIEGTARK